jgi:hypothetical protein
MAVRWQEAQKRSVGHWRRILGSIGRRNAMAIVAELNELSALCEMAGQEAGGEEDRCGHCVVFKDARQCADTRLDISASVLNGESDSARAATSAVLDKILAASPLLYR